LHCVPRGDAQAALQIMNRPTAVSLGVGDTTIAILFK
jgi:hypothetical protein